MRIRVAAILVGLALLAALLPWQAAQAQQGEGAVVLPVVILGDYQPVTGPEFTAAIKELLAGTGRGQKAVWLSSADVSRAGYAAGSQPPSPQTAAALCQQGGRPACVWVGLRFTASLVDNPGGGQTLSLAGAARLWGFDSRSGKVIVDEPLSTVHSAPVAKANDAGDLARATAALVKGTEQDLTMQIVTIADREAHAARVRAWSAPPPQQAGPPAGSQKVTDMMSVVRQYQDAVNRGDLIGIQNAQQQANQIWGQLDREQQNQVEDRYPGTEQWMGGGVWYPGNYYYPGPIYRR